MKKILVIPLAGLGLIVIPLLCKYGFLIVWICLPGSVQNLLCRLGC